MSKEEVSQISLSIPWERYDFIMTHSIHTPIYVTHSICISVYLYLLLTRGDTKKSSSWNTQKGNQLSAETASACKPMSKRNNSMAAIFSPFQNNSSSMAPSRGERLKSLDVSFQSLSTGPANECAAHLITCIPSEGADGSWRGAGGIVGDLVWVQSVAPYSITQFHTPFGFR